MEWGSRELDRSTNHPGLPEIEGFPRKWRFAVKMKSPWKIRMVGNSRKGSGYF